MQLVLVNKFYALTGLLYLLLISPSYAGEVERGCGYFQDMAETTLKNRFFGATYQEQQNLDTKEPFF